MKNIKLMKSKKNKTKTNNLFVQRIIIYIGISLFTSLLYFYTTRNIIYTIILLVLSILFFFLLIERIYKKYSEIDVKTNEFISFINNFIITLSINNSLVTTYDSIKESFRGELKEEVESLSNLDVEEKIKSLKSYFKLNIYDFFLKILDQYIYNGGDILLISQLLIFDSRKLESSLNEFKNIRKRKVLEFMTLWGLNMAILLIIQIALNMFYDKIIEMSFYPSAIFIFFLSFYLFLFLLLKNSFNLSFINQTKEREYEEN